MYDLVLSNGLVYDGLGLPPSVSDVGITGDRISQIGDLKLCERARTIDVSGLSVMPGFIDIHTHSDFSVLQNHAMRSSIAQGVTTEVVGNCGISVGLVTDDPAFAQEKRWAERGGVSITWNTLGEWMNRVESEGIACNIATLAGHGTIRKSVMGFENRPPSMVEIAAMQKLLAQALTDGAVGFSTGLEYTPSGFSDIAEQSALATIAAQAGGFYATHLRNEGDSLVESVNEALEVARRSKVRLQLSHHKVEGKKNWGRVADTLQLMNDARASGLDVLTDQYPYTAYMTSLAVILLPAWANEGETADALNRLTQSDTRESIKKEILAEDWDWSLLTIGSARNSRDIQGLSIAELSKKQGKSPVDAVLDLLISEGGWVAATNFAMSENDIEMVLKDGHTMIGSDGVSNDPGSSLAEDKTHPRTYGTFPRVLSRYVHDRGVLSMSEAVRRMTSLPAHRIGLADRGSLKAGNFADITVIDESAFAERSTYDDPHQLAVGAIHVFVNGQAAVGSGIQTDVLSGKVLRRQ